MNKLPKPTKRENTYTCSNCASNRIDPITMYHVHCDDCGESMDVNIKEFNFIYEFWLERKLRSTKIQKNLAR